MPWSPQSAGSGQVCGFEEDSVFSSVRGAGQGSQLLFTTAVSSAALPSRADRNARPLACEFGMIGNKTITLGKYSSLP